MYVTVAGSTGGVGDQLRALRLLHGLGRSLGYAYRHSTVASWRNHVLRFRAPRTLGSGYPLRGGALDVDPMLGLSAYYASRGELLDPADAARMARVDVVLSDAEVAAVDSPEQLVDSVRRRSMAAGDGARLVRFALRFPYSRVRELVGGLPAPLPDLRTVYFRHGWGATRPSHWPPGCLRIAMHARQGDRAALRAPWCPPERPWVVGAPYGWREQAGEDDFDLLTVDDFHAFAAALAARLEGEAFALQVHSDGFARTVRSLLRSRGVPLRGKAAALRRGAGWEGAFDGFRDLGQVVVGETGENLLRLFDAVLSADVVVAGAPRQHNLTYQLLANSTADSAGPVVLLLHKPGREGTLARLRGTFPRPANVVPVDVRAPDFEAIGNALRRRRQRTQVAGPGGTAGRRGRRDATRPVRRRAGQSPAAPRIWLASYPRSGNTLLRTILSQCFGLRTTSLYPRDLGRNAELERVVGHYERRDFPAGPDPGQPLLVKTHGPPRDDAPAVYVVRDGRAAAVSLRDWFAGGAHAGTTLREVVAGVHPFGIWAGHVETWAPWSRPDTLLVRYEDMTGNLSAVLEALGAFLDRPILHGTIPPRRELAAVGGRWIREFADWREQVTAADMRLFWRLNGAAMERLGYPVDDPVPWIGAGAASGGWGSALHARGQAAYWGCRRKLWETRRSWRRGGGNGRRRADGRGMGGDA